MVTRYIEDLNVYIVHATARHRFNSNLNAGDRFYFVCAYAYNIIYMLQWPFEKPLMMRGMFLAYLSYCSFASFFVSLSAYGISLID